MRDDMDQVLTSRPRIHGDGGKSIPPKGTKKRLSREMNSEDGELLRKFESNAPRRAYGWNGKGFGELLGPLRGFVLSCVGRKWDDVYSEIRSHINMGNMSQKHILTHLWQYVAVNVIIDDKGLPREKIYPYAQIHERTYVHPVSGILTKSPPRKKYKYSEHKPAIKWISLNDGRVACCKDGIWYACTFVELPNVKSFSAYDVLLKEYIFYWYPTVSTNWKGLPYTTAYNKNYVEDVLRKAYGKLIYCTSKKQMNKAEIRKMKRNNNVG